MGLANIGGPTQTVVLGALLIVGVLRPAIFRAVGRLYRLLSPSGRRRIELEEGPDKETPIRTTELKIRKRGFAQDSQGGTDDIAFNFARRGWRARRARPRRCSGLRPRTRGFKIMMTPKWTGFPYFEAAARGGKDAADGARRRRSSMPAPIMPT